MRAFLWLTLPLSLCAAVPATAQDDDLDNQTICVGTPLWRPALAEAAAIAAAPVPPAFRRVYESRDPCLERTSNLQLLVDWHLRFGSGDSIAAALAYGSRELTPGAPAPESYRVALEQAWRAAQDDLRRTHRIEQPPNVNYSAQSRFMEGSSTIRAFRTLTFARERYAFLAAQYLRAAEEFGSLTLLDGAERYLRAALAGTAFLAPLEQRMPVQGLFGFDLDIFVTDDLEMRAAVLRAALTRTPADFSRAETVVQAKERPYYRRLAENAFSTGDDFCDSSDDSREPDEEARRLCSDNAGELQSQVVNQLLARAMLDIVADKEAVSRANGSDEVALGVLERERLFRGRCCLRNPVDDIVRLRLARAAYSARRLDSRMDRSDGSYGSDWDRALTDLETAERLTPPHEAPARTRRIALAWLELVARADTLFPPQPGEQPRAMLSPARQRYATYLRLLLASLDAITAGTGLPPRTN